jgi:hypothetical protein
VAKEEKDRSALLAAARKMFKQRKQQKPQAKPKQAQERPQARPQRIPFRLADDLDLRENLKNAMNPDRLAELAAEIGQAKARAKAKRMPDSVTRKYFKRLDALKKRERAKRGSIVFRLGAPRGLSK